MAIYDNNGTTDYEIGKLYDNNGTTDYQIGKVYDNNGTTDSLIYTAEQVIFDGTTVANGYSISQRMPNGTLATYGVYENGYVRTFSTDDTARYMALSLDQPIDVTNLTTIEAVVQWTAVGSGSNWKDAMLKTSLTNGTIGENRAVSTRANNNTTKQTLTLNVADLSGSYYFLVGHYHEYGTATIRLYSLKMY